MELTKSLFIILLSFISSHSYAKEVNSLCTSNEVVYFSCETDKGTLSLCGSKKGSKLEGIQVRFGQGGSLRFSYPASMKNSLNPFKYTRYTRPLVTYLKVSFESNSVKYELYRDSSYEENPKREDWAAGLIKASGSNIDEIAICSNQPIDRLFELEDILENKDVFE